MDPISLAFDALADPTRRAILARLALGEASVKELAEPFDMSLQAVSKHLKVLERGGLITRSKDAQFRPCRAAPAGIRDITEWLEEYARLVGERLGRLDDYLQEIQKGGSA